MSNSNPRNSTKTSKNKGPKAQGIVIAKGVTPAGKKVAGTTGDKNAQVLAATVGGAVIGNLIAPGIGGAVFGGLIGALLGNGSHNKGGK